MKRAPVRFFHEPSRAPAEYVAWLGTDTYIASLTLRAANLGSDKKVLALLHENYHYQQFLSTPFGLNIALAMWERSLRLASVLKRLAQAGRREISIPLARACEYDEELRRALGGAVQHFSDCRQWRHLMLDSTRPENPASESEMAGMCSRFLMAQVETLRGLRIPVHPSSEIRIVGFGEAPFLPKIGERFITGNHVLENAAHICAEEYVGTAAELLDYLGTSDRTCLAAELLALAPADIDQLSFQVAVGAVCDLALFGSALPGLLPCPLPLSWKAIHPAWRMVAILDTLRNRPDIATCLFTSAFDFGLSESLAGAAHACDQVARVLGFSPIGEIVDQIQNSLPRYLYPPFSYLFDEFRAALQHRVENRGLMPSHQMASISDLLQETLEYDPRESGTFTERVEARMIANPVNQKLRLPIVLGDDAFGGNGSEEMAAYGLVMAYMDDFAEQLMFGEWISYSLSLKDEEWIRSMFKQWWGFGVDQVFPCP